MTNIKVTYATGEYLFTEEYGKVKVLGCKPFNTLIVKQENGTILEISVPYAGFPGTLKASKVEITDDKQDEGDGSDSDSGSSPDVSTDPDPDTLDPNS